MHREVDADDDGRAPVRRPGGGPAAGDPAAALAASPALALADRGVLALAEPVDAAPDRFRAAVLRELGELGRAEAGYRGSIWWSTLLHFAAPVADRAGAGRLGRRPAVAASRSWLTADARSTSSATRTTACAPRRSTLAAAALTGVPEGAAVARTPDGPPPPPTVQRLRVHYAKRGRLRFSSHRDFQRAFERALRRAAVPMAYSAGFSPHPKVSYAGAAPTGVASEAEYLEIGLAAALRPGAAAGRAGRLAAGRPGRARDRRGRAAPGERPGGEPGRPAAGLGLGDPARRGAGRPTRRPPWRPSWPRRGPRSPG